jgi:hypothetical protein
MKAAQQFKETQSPKPVAKHLQPPAQMRLSRQNTERTPKMIHTNLPRPKDNEVRQKAEPVDFIPLKLNQHTLNLSSSDQK